MHSILSVSIQIPTKSELGNVGKLPNLSDLQVYDPNWEREVEDKRRESFDF